MTLMIGLTGGIASGKSTVSNMFKELGITVIDADVEARLAVQQGEPAYKLIVSEFGEDILLENGEIDRPKLGSIIFYDSALRQRLNEITHPEVRKRMAQQMQEAVLNGEKAVVLDIPLLFEGKLTHMVEKTILVYVDAETQLKRLMNRNPLSKDEAKARIQSQMPLSEKVKLADAVIDNTGTIESTKQQLLAILRGWGIIED
ncbi:dephospho-CoA kinase [Neobacillus muris]|uniref:dephospho-CoA kinase n=1 Tax=Neobacillus muris TaxID=2941334 RepID=UPI002041D6E0|nr:dephospho-CoA kinase [Neobacillus muris]